MASAGTGRPGADARDDRPAVTGEVVSDLMRKTVVVSETRSVRNPKYGKFVNRTTRFYVHDEKEVAKLGDLVEIVQTRPLSKLKRWRLVRVVRASEGRVRGEKDIPVPGLESVEAAPAAGSAKASVTEPAEASVAEPAEASAAGPAMASAAEPAAPPGESSGTPGSA